MDFLTEPSKLTRAQAKQAQDLLKSGIDTYNPELESRETDEKQLKSEGGPGISQYPARQQENAADINLARESLSALTRLSPERREDWITAAFSAYADDYPGKVEVLAK